MNFVYAYLLVGFGFYLAFRFVFIEKEGKEDVSIGTSVFKYNAERSSALRAILLEIALLVIMIIFYPLMFF